MSDTNNGNPYEEYPQTPHPEDQPGYGYSPYQGQQAYQDPYGAPLGSSAQPGVREMGTGKIDVMRAVNWGLSTTFKNWTVWILATLAFFTVLFVISFVVSIVTVVANGGEPTASPAITLFSAAAGLAVSLLFYNAATRQLDRAKIGWGDFFRGMNAGPLIGFLLLNAALGMLLLTVVELIAIGSVQTLAGVDPAIDWATLSKALAGQAVAMLISFLIAPLLVFIPFFLADRRAGFVDAIRLGIAAGARNYGKLLLAMFLIGLVGFLAALVTLGLGALVVLPAYMLVNAHLYRQAAGFELPVEQR